MPVPSVDLSLWVLTMAEATPGAAAGGRRPSEEVSGSPQWPCVGAGWQETQGDLDLRQDLCSLFDDRRRLLKILLLLPPPQGGLAAEQG